MERGHEIKVLDHGYVRLIDYMGSDEAIVEDARMSTSRGFVSWEPYRRCKKCGETCLDNLRFACENCRVGEWEQFPRGDQGLLETLVANRHTTPLETGGELKIEVQAPIFVFREWHRHRTQSYNEFSARYAQMPDLHYLPELERFQKQSASNKQGSATELVDTAANIWLKMRATQQRIYNDYECDLGEGLAREVARINTPVSRYSKMRAKTDLWNWFHFLGLRQAAGAQWEIRQYADAVGQVVAAIWPRAHALFVEHQLRATRLSRSECAALSDYLTQLEMLGHVSGDPSPALRSALKKVRG